MSSEYPTDGGEGKVMSLGDVRDITRITERRKGWKEPWTTQRKVGIGELTSVDEDGVNKYLGE